MAVTKKNTPKKSLTGGGTVLYLTQKTAAIKPMSLKTTRAVSGAARETTGTSSLAQVGPTESASLKARVE